MLALGLLILATAVSVYAIFTGSTSVTPNDFATDTLDPSSGLGATGGASIDLSWTATPDTYGSGHRVLRATTTGGPYTQIAEVTPRTTTDYTDSPADGTYYYVVRAFHQNWESVNSNEASATKTSATPMRLATGTYTGDGVDSRPITGVGFQPDIVFVKCACGGAGVARTSTMTGDATKLLNNAGGLAANHVQTLDADGFTVGNSANTNASGNTYYWAAFKTGDELKLGTYVGDGTDNRSITGVGFQPVWVITLGDGDDSIFRPSSLSGDNSYNFYSTPKISNRIQALEADGFQIGSDNDVNETGTTYHYIAWAAGSQVSVSSYTGDDSDNRSITGVGFQPEMAWIKRDASSQTVWRPESASGDLALRWAFDSISDTIQALEPDGFQVGTHSTVNADGSLYHHIAFKDGGP